MIRHSSMVEDTLGMATPRQMSKPTDLLLYIQQIVDLGKKSLAHLEHQGTNLQFKPNRPKS